MNDRLEQLEKAYTAILKDALVDARYIEAEESYANTLAKQLVYEVKIRFSKKGEKKNEK